MKLLFSIIAMLIATVTVFSSFTSSDIEGKWMCNYPNTKNNFDKNFLVIDEDNSFEQTFTIMGLPFYSKGYLEIKNGTLIITTTETNVPLVEVPTKHTGEIIEMSNDIIKIKDNRKGVIYTHTRVK